MALLELTIAEESKDCALSCEGYGDSLLGCRRVDFGRLLGTERNYKCFSLRLDATQASCGRCAIYVLEERSSSSMTMLHHTPIAAHRKKLKKKIGWEVFRHPSYSPNLAPSDNRLFGFVKGQMRYQRSYTIDDIQTAGRHCHRKAGTEPYRKGISKLPERKCMCKSKQSIVYSNFDRGFSIIKQNMSEKIVAHYFRCAPRAELVRNK